jgi:hypothetical protein
LIKAIKKINPTEFILPDVLFDSDRTLKRTRSFFDTYNNSDLKYMAVPQGKTIEEAVINLKEATELYLEEFPITITSRPLLTTFQVSTHA